MWVVKRRNQIAHEADIDPTLGLGNRWNIDELMVGDAVNFIEQVSYQGMFDLLSSADAALLFVNRHIKEFLSTKYIESIAARIPIVLIGEKGFVSDFIEYNNLGIFIDAKNLESEFIDIPERLRTLEYNTAFDISPYTFEKQAKEIIELFD